MTTDELIAAAAPKLGALGGAFYFDPKTLAMGKEHGLDGFRFYFLGRGGVMGDAEPAVVVSAFGYFNPALVDKIWTTGRQKMAPAEAATLYRECCWQYGRDRLGGIADLDVFCGAAEAIIAADRSGRPHAVCGGGRGAPSRRPAGAGHAPHLGVAGASGERPFGGRAGRRSRRRDRPLPPPSERLHVVRVG